MMCLQASVHVPESNKLSGSILCGICLTTFNLRYRICIWISVLYIFIFLYTHAHTHKYIYTVYMYTIYTYFYVIYDIVFPFQLYGKTNKDD